MLIPVIIILIAAASFTMVVLVKNNNPLHNVLKSGRVRGVCCTFLLVCLPLILFQDNLYAQPGLRLYSRDYSSAYGEKNREVFLDIECHSGTPPVLEFLLKDREYIVSKLDFDFESDGEIDLVVFPRRAEENEDNVVFRGAPYRQKGVYNPTVYIHTPYGTFLRRFNIGYADFIWGRDNFNFANDGKFENAVDFVSTTVVDWAEAKFGTLTQDQKVVLLNIMYTLYKGSIGRCYGFSGGEVYYHEHPDKVPYPYLSTYDMSESDESILREMDFVQNDIVFANFVSGKIRLTDKQESEDLRAEIEKLKKRIGQGKPHILGYLSRKMHHSMVVYGYFHNTFRDSITLLVANNWERDQNNNYYSEDAENIVIQFSENTHDIRWWDLTKKKYRYPLYIFAIEREENYVLDSDDLFSLIAQTVSRILQDNKIILMVEKIEEAYMVDNEGKKRGYKKPRYFNDIDDINFRKIDYNYVFEIPKEKEYTLILKKRRYNKDRKRYEAVNMFGILPSQSDVHTVYLCDIPVDEQHETKYHVSKDGIHLVEQE